MLNMDKFYSTNCYAAAKSAFGFVNQLQGAPTTLVAGGAVFFLLLCEGLGVDPRAALTAGERMIRDAENFGNLDTRGHVDAIRLYVENELGGRQ